MWVNDKVGNPFLNLVPRVNLLILLHSESVAALSTMLLLLLQHFCAIHLPPLPCSLHVLYYSVLATVLRYEYFIGKHFIGGEPESQRVKLPKENLNPYLGIRCSCS